MIQLTFPYSRTVCFRSHKFIQVAFAQITNHLHTPNARTVLSPATRQQERGARSLRTSALSPSSPPVFFLPRGFLLHQTSQPPASLELSLRLLVFSLCGHLQNGLSCFREVTGTLRMVAPRHLHPPWLRPAWFGRHIQPLLDASTRAPHVIPPNFLSRIT